MKDKKAKIVKKILFRPRGWLRTIVVGEEDERAKHLKKAALYVSLFLVLGNVIRGVVKSDGEPLGDLKLAEQARAPEALSPYEAAPFRESAGRAERGTGTPTKFSGLELFNRPSAPIPSGILVKATLLTGASQGPAEAKITEDGKDKGIVVVKAGTRVRGTATPSENRVTIQFTKMDKSDGSEEPIQAQAYDIDDKTAGIKASRFWHEVKKFAFAGALNFASGLAEGLQDTTVQNNVAIRNSSLKNGLLNGAGEAARGEAQEVISDFRSKPPAPEVGESTTFYLGFE